MPEDVVGSVELDRVGMLSIQEAAALFGIPAATLRRRITHGEIAGAHKQKGKRGMEWRLPDSSLEALGYTRTDTTRSRPATKDLARALHRLTESLQSERRRWEEWDRQLGWARAEIARLEAHLRRERARNKELERELASVSIEPGAVQRSEASRAGATEG